ncbi:MAG: Mut7-C RNAse domain-containing protein [Deltaproteobacteria bacterium]|nr:Mut7-C RNAse domain-containing protein [Deltaproteobacteria bacterium]
MRFICDSMLGKLAKYLRILGLDAIYFRPSRKGVETIFEEPYYFFTRRKKSPYQNTVYIKADRVQDQLREIKNIIKPYVDTSRIMMRCIKCNKELEAVEKDKVEPLVPEYVFHTQKQFYICPQCKKVYWSGSHVENMYKWIRELLEL